MQNVIAMKNNISNENKMKIKKKLKMNMEFSFKISYFKMQVISSNA